jgi:hypothetical protein
VLSSPLVGGVSGGHCSRDASCIARGTIQPVALTAYPRIQAPETRGTGCGIIAALFDIVNVALGAGAPLTLRLSPNSVVIPRLGLGIHEFLWRAPAGRVSDEGRATCLAWLAALQRRPDTDRIAQHRPDADRLNQRRRDIDKSNPHRQNLDPAFTESRFAFVLKPPEKRSSSKT